MTVALSGLSTQLDTRTQVQTSQRYHETYTIINAHAQLSLRTQTIINAHAHTHCNARSLHQENAVGMQQLPTTQCLAAGIAPKTNAHDDVERNRGTRTALTQES